MYDDKTVRLEKRTRGLAIGLLVTAALTPLAWLAFASSVTEFEAGELLGRILIGSGLLILVVGFIFRKSSPLSKAKARLVVALVVLVSAGAQVVTGTLEHAELKAAISNVGQTLDYEEQAQADWIAGKEPSAKLINTSAPGASGESEKAVLARFLNNVAGANRIQTDRLNELTARFAEADMSTVLVPANLVSAAGLAKSKKTLNEFSRFLDERNLLFYTLADDNEAMVNNSGLPPRELDTARQSFQKGKAATTALMKDLDRAQRGIVTAATAILAMCEENLGVFSVENDNLVVQTDEQVAIYGGHLAKLQEFAALEEKATNELIAADEAHRESVRKDLAEFK